MGTGGIGVADNRSSHGAFLESLLSSRTVEKAAEALAAAIVDLGCLRAVVCHLSADKKALVVQAHQWKHEFRGRGGRISLEKNPYSSRSLLSTECTVYSRSDRRSLGPITVWEALSIPVPLVWIEAPIVTPDTEAIGIALVELPVGSEDVPEGLEKGLLRMTSAYRTVAQTVARSCELACTGQAQQLLLGLDTEITSEIRQSSPSRQPEFSGIYQVVAQQIVAHTQAEVCTIRIVKEKDFRTVAQSGSIATKDIDIRIGDTVGKTSLLASAVSSSGPHIYIGKRQDKQFKAVLDTLPPAEIMVHNKLRAWGVFPIKAGGKVLGAVTVASSDWDFFANWRRYLIEAAVEKCSLLGAVEGILGSDKRRISKLTTDLSHVAQRSAYSEAARTVVHNLANLMQGFERHLDRINTWSRSGKGKFPSVALEGLTEISGLVEDVISFYARIRGGGQIEDLQIDINKAVTDAKDLCDFRAEEWSMRIDVRPDPLNPVLVGPEPELLQAFINLIHNGLDAMREREGGAKRLLIRVASTDGQVSVRFEDHGVGIASQHRKRVFDVDYTTKRDRGGTGLGLAHVKRVVERYWDGKVGISSKQNRGTTVTLTFPKRRRQLNG